MEILPFAVFKRRLWKNLMHFLGIDIRVNFRSGVQSSVLKLLSLDKKSLFIVRGSLYEFRFSGKMLWIFCYFLVCVSFTNLETAEDQCRSEVDIRGMALKGFVLKRMTVAAPHICDILCERETICQSYNFNRKEQICELNHRTKDARPENFRSDPAWFYIRRLNGRGKYSPKHFIIILNISVLQSVHSLPFPISRN